MFLATPLIVIFNIHAFSAVTVQFTVWTAACSPEESLDNEQAAENNGPEEQL